MSAAPRSARREYALTAVNVSKHFGGVQAVTNIDLDIRPGTCHAVIGENGAGKSTLMRILSGEIAPSAGTVLVGGRPAGRGVHAAHEAGIAMVHQELSLVSDLSVAENIVLGSTPTVAGFVRGGARRAAAVEALARVDLSVDPDEITDELPLAARQFVELAKALHRNPEVLILDEPTASLTPQESDALHSLLTALAGAGMAIVYISHRIDDVLALCQTITVLRDGQKVRDIAAADTERDELVSLMVGHNRLGGVRTSTSERRQRGDVVLTARNIVAPMVNDASLDVHAHEIVGIGGVVGAGRSEWIRAILGVDPREAGEVWITTERGRHRIRSYQDALRHGVAYVPEDRRLEGLGLEMSVEDNLSLPSVSELASLGLLSRKRKLRLVKQAISATSIKTASTRTDAGALSGGNQQKIVFGKWLPRKPRLIVLDEPTRGVDVGAKAEIHRMIRAIADAGTAVLLVSSDLPELLDLSDTIIVLCRGTITGTLQREDATPDHVISLATRSQHSVIGGA